MNIDKFLDKQYDLENYNCGHFVAEVYKELTGDDISEICEAFSNNVNNKFSTMLKRRARFNQPVTPCIVIMRSANTVPHAGIYMNNRVLHLSGEGPKLEHLDVISKTHNLSFYK